MCVLDLKGFVLCRSWVSGVFSVRHETHPSVPRTRHSGQHRHPLSVLQGHHPDGGQLQLRHLEGRGHGEVTTKSHMLQLKSELSFTCFSSICFRTGRSSCQPSPERCVRWVTGPCLVQRSSSSGRRTEASRFGTCCKTPTSLRRVRTLAAPPSPASEPAASPVRQKLVYWCETQRSAQYTNV